MPDRICYNSKMKKIDVPLYLQAPNSMDCGPVCTQIVLEHFGNRIDLPTLISKLDYGKNGTSAYDNGCLLLGGGLKVCAITAQPLLFPPDVIPTLKTSKDLLGVAAEREEKFPKDKPILNTFKAFLSDGGKVTLEIPTISHIRAAIDTECLVIALLYGRAMGSMEGGFHFVVVNGYDEERVFITNPLPGSKQQDWIPAEQFLYALHASTTSDIDNGTLLVVSR